MTSKNNYYHRSRDVDIDLEEVAKDGETVDDKPKAGRPKKSGGAKAPASKSPKGRKGKNTPPTTESQTDPGQPPVAQLQSGATKQEPFSYNQPAPNAPQSFAGHFPSSANPAPFPSQFGQNTQYMQNYNNQPTNFQQPDGYNNQSAPAGGFGNYWNQNQQGNKRSENIKCLVLILKFLACRKPQLPNSPNHGGI